MTDKPAWVDGDPLMEAIAAAVWEQCGRAVEVPLTVDDPRNIAAVASSVARQRDQSEAALQRVRALRADWLSDGAPPIGTSIARWWDKRLIQLDAALNEPKEPTPPTFTLLHHACGQLADIPGDVTLHPGRLSWPGHDCPADTPKEPTS